MSWTGCAKTQIAQPRKCLASAILSHKTQHREARLLSRGVPMLDKLISLVFMILATLMIFAEKRRVRKLVRARIRRLR